MTNQPLALNSIADRLAREARQREADAAAVAAFLAKRNPTKVAVGTSSGISDREFFLASRGDISLRGPSDNELIDQRHVVGDCVVNGLGELIANKGA